MSYQRDNIKELADELGIDADCNNHVTCVGNCDDDEEEEEEEEEENCFDCECDDFWCDEDNTDSTDSTDSTDDDSNGNDNDCPSGDDCECYGIGCGDDHQNSDDDGPDHALLVELGLSLFTKIHPVPIVNEARVKEVQTPVAKVVVGPVALHVMVTPTATLNNIVVAYNNATGVSLSSANLLSQTIANASSGIELSDAIKAFNIWAQVQIIKELKKIYPDEDIEFEDCDGSCYCNTSACLKPWYLDKDGDGYHSDTTSANDSPGDDWKESSFGPDCDDTNPELTTNCPDCPVPDFQCRPGEFLDENCECQIILDDPCANKDLLKKQISSEVMSLINSRTQPNTMVQSSQMVPSFILETLDDGWGDVNQDRHSLNINSMPDGYTPFTLFDEIRKNFSNIVTGGDLLGTTVTFEPYSTADGVTWNSDNPLGAAMDFSTFMDTSTVICVEYNAEEMYWVFATVTSYDHQGHFVAGVRQFGIEPNASGGHSFYLRGADRLGGVLDYLFNSVFDSVGWDDPLFNDAADATWKNVMETLEDYILDKPGGDVENYDKHGTYSRRHPYNPDDCPD